MNLYLISQSVNTGYDTYDSAVVAAPDEQAARETYPSANYQKQNPQWSQRDKAWISPGGGHYFDCCWCKPKDVTVELLGTAITDEAKVICASFNAG